MKILFVSAIYPWPLTSGGQVRVYELLRRLGKRHVITLASYQRNTADVVQQLPFIKKTITFFRGSAWQIPYIRRALFGQYPFLSATYENIPLQKKIEHELDTGNYDLIHIEPHYVYSVLPQTYSIPLVVCEHNIEYKVYGMYADRSHPILRPFLRLEVKRMKAFEERTWEIADRVIAVSGNDGKVIRQFNPYTSVVSNCVDAKKYSYKKRIIQNDSIRLLFVGNFKWMQNRDALKTLLQIIWPQIHTIFPKSHLNIVGKDLPKYLEKKLPQQSVTYYGFVEDIRSLYAQCDMLLSPIAIGGGTKYKILEAFSSGLPVIASQKSVEGMCVQNNKEFLSAETSDDYISAIRYCIQNPARMQVMTKNARNLVEEKYSWDTQAEKLEIVWKSTSKQK